MRGKTKIKGSETSERQKKKEEKRHCELIVGMRKRGQGRDIIKQ